VVSDVGTASGDALTGVVGSAREDGSVAAAARALAAFIGSVEA
jgi:hypothetical protein